MLNYHHLHYFWAVARNGNLTATARALRVSPSALSAQIKRLEDQLGAPLFERKGRGIELTDAGRIALAYADTIFEAGDELEAVFARREQMRRQVRVGAVATLSRNFQEAFLRPVLDDASLSLRLVSGALADLLSRLDANELDIVLANEPAPTGTRWRSRHLARQRVAFVSRSRKRSPLRVGKALSEVPLLLPGPGSAVRRAFDSMCEAQGIAVRVAAEVDDMALLRLLARDTRAVAVVPPVVVRDELRAGRLHRIGEVPGVYEDFFAITRARRFAHPIVDALVTRRTREILET